MPIVSGLQTTLTRDVNTSMAAAMFPRWSQNWFNKVCRIAKPATALVEPFAFDGASPLLKRFNGKVSGYGVPSFSLQVPMVLWKNFEEISRTTFEADQSGTVRKRSAQIGIRVAQAPNYLAAKRILSGDTETTNYFEGTSATYNSTFDGVTFFSAAHVLGGTTQSNILTGSLPATIAGLKQDLSITVQQLQQDYQAILTKITSLTDDKGALLFPDFDPAEQLVIAGPPCLRTAFQLAYQMPGAMVGGSGGTSGSSGTQTTLPKLVSEVLTPGLLGGCPDIESEEDATVSPKYPTQYYWFIKDDLGGAPLYFMPFRPKKGSEFLPAGYDPEAVADQIIQAAGRGLDNKPNPVAPEAADLYAMTSIDTNLGAIGTAAQESVVKQEKFFMSGRCRMNAFYGLWFLAGKVDPVGYSA